MKILFDESLPYSLRDDFEALTSNYSTAFVQEQNWAGLKNGKLLSKAQKDFDIFLTCDQNLPYQQNIEQFELSLVILKGKTNRREDLKPLLSKLIDKLDNLQNYEIIEIDST